MATPDNKTTNAAELRNLEEQLSSARKQIMQLQSELAASQKSGKAVRASEELLRLFIEHAPCALAMFDHEMKYLHASRRWCRDYGLADPELEGRSHYEIFPEIPAAWKEAHQRGLAGEVVRSEGDRFERADGSVQWIRWEIRPWHEDRGAIGGIILFTEDISRRKLREELQQRSEALYRTLFEYVPDGILIADQQGCYLDANPMMCSMLGLSREELIGLHASDIVDPLEVEHIEPALHQIIAEAEYYREWQFRRKDGSTFVAEVSATKMPDTNLLALVRDVTQRKRLEAQLLQTQKMEAVGTLAGGIAHDFNNMLGLILGRTELGMRRMDPADPNFEALQEIRKAAKRSASLTQQLLGFARKQTIAPKIIDLNAAVEALVPMLRSLVGEHLDLAWVPAQSLAPVKIDPTQLDQLLANLVVNARDAISGAGNITLETAQKAFDQAYCARNAGFVPGDFSMLSVSDDGCGMAADLLGNIFEPFFTTKKFGKGTGLGLAMVYGIVKQNHGFINVYSEPGQGTTFRIYLPCISGVAAEKDFAAPAAIQAGRGETILLVEDETDLLRVTAEMLEDLGYQVLAVNSPTKAIEVAQQSEGTIDLLLTDVVMPEMNGKELAARLATKIPDLKVVFISGYTANVIAHRGILDEGVDFLSKPLSLNDLAEKLTDVLRG